MKKEKSARRALVSGKRPFPIDMLRYDECRPLSEADCHAVEATFGNESGLPISLIVVKNSSSLKEWTPKRWQSFGWNFLGEVPEEK